MATKEIAPIAEKLRNGKVTPINGNGDYNADSIKVLGGMEAVRLRPEFARARLDLASVLAAQGDMKGAVQQLREASKGNDPEVARLAAGALQRLGER